MAPTHEALVADDDVVNRLDVEGAAASMNCLFLLAVRLAEYKAQQKCLVCVFCIVQLITLVSGEWHAAGQALSLTRLHAIGMKSGERCCTHERGREIAPEPRGNTTADAMHGMYALAPVAIALLLLIVQRLFHETKERKSMASILDPTKERDAHIDQRLAH